MSNKIKIKNEVWANTLAAHTVEIMAEKLSHVLASDEVSQEIKNALGDIVVDAGCEAGIHLSEPSIVKVAFPLVMESLDLQYGNGIFHALQTVLEGGVNEETRDNLRQYEKRFDDVTEKPQNLESSDESQQLKDLANHLSAVMKHPLTPTKLYNVMTDELVEIDVDTDSPEHILANLKFQLEKELEKELEGKK